MNEYFIEYVKKILPAERIRIDEPMSKHTTFRVGGPADLFVQPESKEELAAIIKYLAVSEREYFILGNGSNLLVGDHGYRGTVVKISKGFDTIETDGIRIKAGGGAMLSKVAASALADSLSGFEFASGIPGTVGGAMVMNAGAYGGEMKDIVESVETVTEDGDELVLSNDEMQFAYRKSMLRKAKLVVTSVTFRLEKGDQADILSKMEEFKASRIKKQPLEYPSAGSTFKRPEGYFAGKLIMDAGLSGYTIGGAQVSPKHCGFVINIGNACSADIRDLIIEVQEKVRDRFHVKLEPEVCIIGDF
ncbi:UDP-N-acetylmuramate dehydrogenase [Lachnospiraceae bacterium C1.1]|nr:UDP-N-acetylmuramate dehydrogenase [Lachnospiraceae bacterium C1.1]